MIKSKETIYCSQCRHSLYFRDRQRTDKKNVLKCNMYKQAVVPALLPTDCTRASTCPLFEPECKSNVLFKNTNAFNQQNFRSRVSR